MTTIEMRQAGSAGRTGRAGWRVLCGLLFAAMVAGGCSTVSLNDGPVSEVSPARAKRDLGVDYLSSGRTAMAIRELAASLELDPSDPVTELWLGEAYRRKGQTERAREAFEKAAKAAAARKDIQTEQDARLNLSALLAQLGRYADAIPHCESLAADPTFSSPWRPLSNCGWAYLQLGRIEEARERLTRALEYFPRYGPALLNLGILEQKQGHNLAAVSALERSIASGRLNRAGRTEASFRLGEIFVALGNREKAIAHFRAAVETGPALEWGSQSQAYLDLLR